MPFWRGMWRQSFPIPPLKVLTQEEQSGPRKLQKECHRTAPWLESKENQAAASQRDIPTCGPRQQDTGTACSLFQPPQNKPYFWKQLLAELSCQAPEQETTERSGSPEVLHKEPSCSWLPAGQQGARATSSACVTLGLAKAATSPSRGSFGVFSINLQICPTHFLCHKRRKQPKSMPSSQIMLSVTMK